MIGGLDSKYNHFVSSFKIRSNCESFDEFPNQLMIYERWLKFQNSQDVSRLVQPNLAKFFSLSLKGSFETHVVSKSSSNASGSSWNLQDNMRIK